MEPQKIPDSQNNHQQKKTVLEGLPFQILGYIIE